MNIQQSVTTCMHKYATFSGRASGSEFWWFSLFAIVLIWLAGYAGQTLYWIANILLVLPSFAVFFRRPHVAIGLYVMIRFALFRTSNLP